MPGQMPERGAQLRPALASDEPLLLAVFASTRADLLAALPFSAEQKATFLHQQFEAQQASYTGSFGNLELAIILLDGEPVGRLYLAHEAERVCLVDIALLPEQRGRGIGSSLMRRVLDDADQQRKPVHLHVEASNPARRLYERLGFRRIGGADVYWHYERPVRSTTVPSDPEPMTDPYPSEADRSSRDER